MDGLYAVILGLDMFLGESDYGAENATYILLLAIAKLKAA